MWGWTVPNPGKGEKRKRDDQDDDAVLCNVVLLTQRGAEGNLGGVLFGKRNSPQRVEDKWDRGKIGSSVILDRSMVLQVGTSRTPVIEFPTREVRLSREQKCKDYMCL